MLTVIIPGIRHGEAILNTSVAYQGRLCYIKGVDSGGKVILDVPTSSAAAIRAYYPIQKITYNEFSSDTSDAVDKLAKGTRVVYYAGGEYVTNQCDYANIFAHTAYAEVPADPYSTVSAYFSTTVGWGLPLYVGYTSTVGYGKLTIQQLCTGHWLGWAVGTVSPALFDGDSGNCFLTGAWGHTAAGIIRFRMKAGKVGRYGPFPG